MNYTLIMLPQPILVSDEEANPHEAIWDCVNSQVTVLRQSYGLTNYMKIIAGIEGLPKLDLSLIAEEIGWVDVEKLAYNLYGGGQNTNNLSAFIDGYKTNQSLNEKKYSEEELKDALFYALNIKSETCCTTDTKDSIVRSTIKFLSKPKEYQVEEYIKEENTIKVTKIIK